MAQVERHGYDHIPEEERGMTASQAAYLWVATNANLFFVSVGVIAVGAGLAVWHALVAVVLGTLLFAAVALGSIGGVRAGLPTMTFTRAVFGVRGNVPHALLAWATSVAFEAINGIFAVYALLALAAYAGWDEPGALAKALAAVAVTVAAAAIAVYGHRAVLVAQRAFAVALTLALSGVLAYTIGSVDWAARDEARLSGGAALAGVLAAGAVIASGPISYLYNAPDWVRYLPSRTAGRTIFWTVFASSAAIALFLSVMGVLLASQTDMSDPIAGVEPLVPGAIYVLYVLSAIGGSIANSVVTFYSSGLCLQAVGLPLRRHTATVLDAIVSTALVLAVLLVADFTEVLEDFVALLIVWLAPFAAVWITDGMLRGWSYDPAAIHDVTPRSRYWGWRGVGVAGWVAVAAGAAVCLLTIDAPILQGPLSRALDGADLAWLAGPAASAAVYLVLGGRQSRPSSRARETAAARVSASSLR